MLIWVPSPTRQIHPRLKQSTVCSCIGLLYGLQSQILTETDQPEPDSRSATIGVLPQQTRRRRLLFATESEPSVFLLDGRSYVYYATCAALLSGLCNGSSTTPPLLPNGRRGGLTPHRRTPPPPLPSFSPLSTPFLYWQHRSKHVQLRRGQRKVSLPNPPILLLQLTFMLDVAGVGEPIDTCARAEEIFACGRGRVWGDFVPIGDGDVGFLPGTVVP
jgi:hypothetical protein